MFRSAGRIYEDENSLPENAVHIVGPPRGRCASNNLCFRGDHQWACDVGTCHKNMAEQSLSDLTGKYDPRCKCKPLNTAFINQVIIYLVTIKLRKDFNFSWLRQGGLRNN